MFVCIDDYSRFSWVNFLKEKSDTFNACKILFLKLIREKKKTTQEVFQNKE